MLEIPELVEYSLILMVREKLDRIEKTYKEKTWIKLFLSYARKSLSDIEEELLNENLRKNEDHGKSDDKLSKSEIISMLKCLKHEMAAEDYLFIKSCLIEDDKEMGFLLEQALMINPQDPHLFALSTVFASDTDVGFNKLLPIFSRYKFNPTDRGIKLFTKLMHLSAFLEQPKEKQTTKELDIILRSLPLRSEMRVSLIFHLIGRTNPWALLEVLDEWNPASFDPHPLYELIKGVLQFRTGNYKVAAKVLESADIPSQPLSEWEKSPYTYMLSKALQYSGQHGRAVMMWQEIINDPNHSERGTSVYFKALFDLSSYHLRKEDYNKAKAILVNIKEAFMEYMQESRGEQYFTLLGDISLGEGDCIEALGFYEKAFSISPSGDVADKIKLLKK